MKIHICEEIKESIKNHIHEKDLRLEYEEEFEGWNFFHDNETVYFDLRYCPFCGEKLEYFDKHDKTNN